MITTAPPGEISGDQTSRPLLKPAALPNGETSNNAIDVVRNWRRCMDLELSVKVQHEAGLRAGLDYRTPHIVIAGVNQHASCVPETHGGKFLIVSKLSTPTFWRFPRLAGMETQSGRHRPARWTASQT
jgi:hypothetical protein